MKLFTYTLLKILRKCVEKQTLDEDEFVELLHVSTEIEEMESLVTNNKIYDAKTAFAYLWLKDHVENVIKLYISLFI